MIAEENLLLLDTSFTFLSGREKSNENVAMRILLSISLFNYMKILIF